MNTKHYTDERHTQILVYLLKKHNIKKIIVSPGTTNMTLVGSLQNDPYFEIFSSVDERSAAYLACGLAAESGEAVVLSCTGATASRNYLSGLTEAYYRKLPVLAVTSCQHPGRIGHNYPQVIDRSQQLNDICKKSYLIPVVNNSEDEWSTTVKINDALCELFHNGGGPVHLNLCTTYSKNYDVEIIKDVRVIHRIEYKDKKPDIPAGKIGIFVGAHLRWSRELTDAVDDFCRKYNGVVLCDATSNYYGKYRVSAPLITSQREHTSSCMTMDLLIHLGDVSGSNCWFLQKRTWRVNPDGVIRDTFKSLEFVFEMSELDFFKYYTKNYENSNDTNTSPSFYDDWRREYNKIYDIVPELPFSNVWIAYNSIKKIPQNSVLYLGILNTLRSWNYFELPEGISCYSNTGGFGIDGGLSTVIGASLNNDNKLYFGVVGDLGFFYDLNVLGNRHVPSSIRILLINNGLGTEFTNYNHPAAQFGEDAKPYMAAAGHFGNKSKDLVRHFSEDLGYRYISADDKDSYIKNFEEFINPDYHEKPIIFEVFTDNVDESDAVKTMNTLMKDSGAGVKKVVKKMIGEEGVSTLKKLINK